MKKIILSIMLLTSFSTANATIIDVFAFGNSINGGTGASTGVILSAGDIFAASADVNDLWSAGALPRWSNADGLIGNLFATGSDDSGQAAGTQIGANFDLFNGTPFGTLVGSLDGNFFSIGTNFVGNAVASGELLLWYWDSNNGDNTGSIALTIETDSGPGDDDDDVVAVPEPSVIALFAAGLFGLGFARRRKA